MGCNPVRDFLGPGDLNFGIGIDRRQQQFGEFFPLTRGELLSTFEQGFDALVQGSEDSGKWPRWRGVSNSFLPAASERPEQLAENFADAHGGCVEEGQGPRDFNCRDAEAGGECAVESAFT